jgi:neurotrimin
MRSDQTVLSVGKMVTQNSRYSVNHEEGSKWSLKIHSVRESDEGCYICQINTQPLLKASGCIQLQFPPDISDEESSTDTTIHEGRNVTLHCSARGNPQPRILWRRDDGIPIKMRSEYGAEATVDIFNGSSLKLVNARRDQMSAYLCIAVNGVEPAISKRIFLHVQCESRSFSYSAISPRKLNGFAFQLHQTSHPSCSTSKPSRMSHAKSIALSKHFPAR